MKTKKFILSSMAILLLTMLSLPLSAQIKFGVKADVGLNNPSFNSDALKVENMTSYSIGPSIEAMFPFAVVDFGIEASLLYNDNRMTVSNLSGEGNEPQEVYNRYLNLPVNAKVKFGLGMLPLRMFATAGPYAGYLLSGDGINFQDVGDDIKAKEFQAGANIGFGVEVLHMIQVGLNYSVQLTDNYAHEEPNWRDPLNGKTETWSITGAVYF
ncbi:MAG: PorT family protein [Proteiniphilum sp.]|nr:PorT family protein [Proteiniphilum sp.]